MTHQELQAKLRELGFYSGRLDGIIGPISDRAIERFLSNRVTADISKWSRGRKTLAAKQAIMANAGIETGPIDGLLGPQTRYALNAWETLQSIGTIPLWRDAEPEVPVPQPPIWPKQRDVERFFGERGKNQTRLQLPYTMRLAWQKSTKVTSFLCHEKVHDSLERIFRNVMSEYPPAAITALGLDLFGGCLNVRRMRGGSAWSMHSWGIAVDIDPERNRLHWGKDRARLASPEADAFWRIVEGEGWVSLGRVRNYDYMHFQAARP